MRTFPAFGYGVLFFRPRYVEIRAIAISEVLSIEVWSRNVDLNASGCLLEGFKRFRFGQ